MQQCLRVVACCSHSLFLVLSSFGGGGPFRLGLLFVVPRLLVHLFALIIPLAPPVPVSRSQFFFPSLLLIFPLLSVPAASAPPSFSALLQLRHLLLILHSIAFSSSPLPRLLHALLFQPPPLRPPAPFPLFSASSFPPMLLTVRCGQMLRKKLQRTVLWTWQAPGWRHRHRRQSRTCDAAWCWTAIHTLEMTTVAMGQNEKR